MEQARRNRVLAPRIGPLGAALVACATMHAGPQASFSGIASDVESDSRVFKPVPGFSEREAEDLLSVRNDDYRMPQQCVVDKFEDNDGVILGEYHRILKS